MPSSLRANSDSCSRSPTSGRRVPSSSARMLTRSSSLSERVVGMHAGPGEQLGDDFLVDVGVLPHVQTGQVKTEDVHGFSQPGQPVVGQQGAAVGAQRGVDDVEVGQQLLRRRVGRQAEVEQVGRLLGPGSASAVAVSRARMTRRARRYGSSRAGRLVAGRCQRREFVSDGDQSRRHRQLLLQRCQLGGVATQRGVGRAAGGQSHHVGGDVRVAVAVAADPRAGPQDGFGRAGRRRASGCATRRGPRR